MVTFINFDGETVESCKVVKLLFHSCLKDVSAKVQINQGRKVDIPLNMHSHTNHNE